jgi:hypothetical protein
MAVSSSRWTSSASPKSPSSAYSTAGQRKHLIAEEYLQTHVVTTRCSSSRLAGFTRTAPGRRWAVRNPARPIAALGLTLRE